jgi:hypothetical protein
MDLFNDAPQLPEGQLQSCDSRLSAQHARLARDYFLSYHWPTSLILQREVPRAYLARLGKT